MTPDDIKNQSWFDALSQRLGTSQLTHALAKVEQIERDNAKLRDALKFYADPQSYGLGGGNIQRVIVDSGAIARGALRPSANADVEPRGKTAP